MLTPHAASRTTPLLEQVAIFAERRHEVLAGNMANISTPGYRSRDLPVVAFQQALEAATHCTQPTSYSQAHLSAAPPNIKELFPTQLFQAEERAPQNLTFQDENNRSIEFEVMEMSKNSMLQSYAVELLTAQVRLLEAVIAERP